MYIRATDNNAREFRVYFNDKPAPYVVAANEEEQWVEVLDTKFIGMIAPLAHMNTPDDGEPEQSFEPKIKRLTGKVVIKRDFARKS